MMMRKIRGGEEEKEEEGKSSRKCGVLPNHNLDFVYSNWRL
jgi:hypothetical protein